VFTRQVWFAMLQPLHLASLMPGSDSDVGEWWLRQRRRMDSASRPLFNSLLLLVVWSIWKEKELQGVRQAAFNRASGSPGSIQGRRGLGDGWIRAVVGASLSVVAICNVTPIQDPVARSVRAFAGGSSPPSLPVC
jgi:hypothetical protein